MDPTFCFQSEARFAMGGGVADVQLHRVTHAPKVG